jgi:hypothetical protein
VRELGGKALGAAFLAEGSASESTALVPSVEQLEHLSMRPLDVLAELT